jgi:hypothetical protein
LTVTVGVTWLKYPKQKAFESTKREVALRARRQLSALQAVEELDEAVDKEELDEELDDVKGLAVLLLDENVETVVVDGGVEVLGTDVVLVDMVVVEQLNTSSSL